MAGIVESISLISYNNSIQKVHGLYTVFNYVNRMN